MLASIITMTVFSLSMSISPGPVNMAIASSGARHGVKRTLPFVSGATLGFTMLLLMVGLALHWAGALLAAAMPWLQAGGALFTGWIGWKIATADTDHGAAEDDIPSFMQGWLLQWLNPKAWIACLSGAAIFSEPASHAGFVAFAGIYFTICYLSLGAWAMLGHQMSRVLASRGRLRAFNVVMGLLLMGCAVTWAVRPAAPAGG